MKLSSDVTLKVYSSQNDAAIESNSIGTTVVKQCVFVCVSHTYRVRVRVRVRHKIDSQNIWRLSFRKNFKSEFSYVFHARKSKKFLDRSRPPPPPPQYPMWCVCIVYHFCNSV